MIPIVISFSSDFSLNVFGTEYQIGDNATVWLQLLRNYQPVNNATCYMASYYPNNHTKFFDDVIMNYLSNSDGIYYYDFTAPSTTGVYMVSAFCHVTYTPFLDDFTDSSKIEEKSNMTINNGYAQLTDSSYALLYPYLWYHLNETNGTNAYDSSTSYQNGTLTNGSIWVEGKMGNALNFTGFNYIDLNQNGNFDRTDSFSVEAWIRTSNLNEEIVSKLKTSIVRGWEFRVNGGKITLNLDASGTAYTGRYSNARIDDGKWHHVVGVYYGNSSASGIVLYIDGSVAVSTVLQDNLNNITTNTADLEIGARDGTGNGFVGTIDEVVIYNKSINQTEVTFRYNSTNGTESMGGATFYATSGYIRSKPTYLGGIIWNSFNATYNLSDGNINFSIQNLTNSTICSSLGNISGCANITTPVKIFTQFVRPNVSSVSPTLDKYLLDWISETVENTIRGSSEIHINPSLNVDTSGIITQLSLVNSSLSNQLTSLNDTATSYFLSLNNTINDANSTLYFNVWNYQNRTIISMTNSTPIDEDSIALAVIKYMIAMGFK
jgi:hypothetical protein